MKPASVQFDVNFSHNVSVEFEASIACIIHTSLFLPFDGSDELIRQVTINCAERGLLLLRVRDELLMTIRGYQTLYESSVAFGMRKAVTAEQGKQDLEQKVGFYCSSFLKKSG